MSRLNLGWRSEPSYYNDNKAIEAQEKIDELRQQEIELIKQKLSNIIEYFETFDNYFNSVISRIDSMFSVKEASGQRLTIADLLDKYIANSDALSNAEEKQFTYQTGISRDSQRSSEEVLAEINRRALNETDLYQRVLDTQTRLTDQQDEYANKQLEIAELKKEIKAESDKQTKKELKAELKELRKEAATLKLSKSQKKTLSNMNKEMEAFSTVYTDSTYYDDIAAKAADLRASLDIYTDLMEQIADQKQAIKDATDKAEKKELKAELKELKAEAKSYKLTKKQKSTLKTYEAEIGAMESIDNYGITKNYSDVLVKQSKLQDRKDQYNDLVAYIADLNQQIKDETDKSYKKELQKELKAAKKEAKKVKLSKSENKTLKALDEQVAAIQKLQEDSTVDNATASTAQYQLLIEKIGKLQTKSKLTTKQQTTLAMYLDELQAINAGVAADNLKSYMSTYEQWWKLQNKTNPLTTAEFKQLNSLTKRKEAIEQAYKDQMNALQQELEDALVFEGKSQADLEANLKKEQAEIRKTYEVNVNDAEDSYKDTATYKNLYAKYQSAMQQLETGKNTKGKKLSKSEKNTLQKNVAKWEEEFSALAMGATSDNISKYIEAWSAVRKMQKDYLAGKLTKKEAAEYDKYVSQLNDWNNAKIEKVNTLQKELEDQLKQAELEFKTQVEENETAINEYKADQWTLAKQLAEFEVSTSQSIIDSLSAIIDRYESVAHVLEETNFEALKKYGIMDLFDLDDEKDVSELLTDQLTNAIESSVQKVQSLAEEISLYEELLDAAGTNDFDAILAKYRDSISEEKRASVDELVQQLNSNNYSDNEWVTEWEQALSDAMSDILTATEEVENFKAELREKVVFKSVTEAIEKCDALISKFSSMSSVIKDDWTVDKSTGALTEFGLAKINVLTSQLRNAQQEVANYAEKVRLIQQAQQDENTAYKDQATYLQELSEAEGQYYSALVSVQQISDQIYQLGKTAQESEIENLKKLTTARLDALAAKKSYYEYDRNIKKQTADIQALEAQLNALNGVETAEAKAQRALLEAQLQDAKDILEDTQTQHQFDLSTSALNDLIEKMEESLSEATEDIAKTFEEFAETLTALIGAGATADTAGSYQKVFDLLMNGSGITVSAGTVLSGNAGSTAAGTSSVVIGGTEYSTVSEGEFLSGLSTTVNTNLTPYLSSMEINLQNIEDMMANHLVSDLEALANNNTSNVNITLNYDNLLNVQGSVDKSVVADIQKLTTDIADYTKSVIYSDLVKSGVIKTYH